jgi:hypothetical protein
MVSYSSTAYWGISMGKHERIKDKPKAASSDEATMSPTLSGLDVTPKMALAAIDMPKPDAPAIDVAKLDSAAIEMPKIETPAIETPKIELAKVAAPHIVPDIEEIKPATAEAATLHAAADHNQDAAEEPPPAESGGPRVNRFTLLAAALALSAGLGGMVGAVAATSLMQSGPAPTVVAGRTGLEEVQALKENVVQARVELAALKTSIDAGNRNATAQFTKIGERVDRFERAQAEPTAKLNKVLDSLDRMSRADAAAPSREVTGSIAPQPPIAGAPRPGGVDGWIVRDVRRGTALIEGRMGIIEVDQGDIVPGLGRVDAIRKQPDGRWLVMTTKGPITSAR